MNIYGIKLLLIRYYKEYIHDKKLLGHLCKKWKYEGKEMFCDSLKKGRASIREIIMNETYNLTETDISLLSYYLGIPIVMLYQGRNRFKLATYKKFNNFKYKYYVKIPKSENMYIITKEQEVKYENNMISKELNNAVVEQSLDDFSSYLKHVFRR